jgi:hypothetical protein
MKSASSASRRVSQIAESRVPRESWRIFRVPEKCHSYAGPSLGHNDGIFSCGIRFLLSLECDPKCDPICNLTITVTSFVTVTCFVTQFVTRYIVVALYFLLYSHYLHRRGYSLYDPRSRIAEVRTTSVMG